MDRNRLPLHLAARRPGHGRTGRPWLSMAAATYTSGILGGTPRAGEFRPGSLALVSLAGSSRHVADDLYFPDGVVVTSGNSTVIVAELRASRLTAFDIDA